MTFDLTMAVTSILIKTVVGAPEVRNVCVSALAFQLLYITTLVL